MKVLLYLFFFSSALSGQAIATYDFSSQLGNQDITYATNVAQGWLVSGITRGSGLVVKADFGTMNSRDFGFTFDANKYYEFSLKTPIGTTYDIPSFNFDVINTEAGPTNYVIAYIVNGGMEMFVDSGTIGTKITFPAQSGVIGGSTFTIRIYAYGAISTNGTFGFSGVNNIGGILPVTYLYFNAKSMKDKVAIDFATASEENNDFFQVERSRDGLNFEALERLPSKITRGGSASYKLIDNSPYSNINYYRIKQVDLNGQFSYSELRSVDLQSVEPTFIYYDQSRDQMEINNFKETFELSVYNISGKIVLSASENTNNQSVSTTNLLQGIYIVRLVSGNDVYSQRILKQ